jgi:hypothetical protein
MILKGLSFEGVISLDEEIYDIGKTTSVTVPDNSIDMVKRLQEEEPQRQLVPPLTPAPLPSK